MSGVAMFGLTFPSLLKFDETKEELELKHNLSRLYHVEQAPSDICIRERCDEIDPREVSVKDLQAFKGRQRENKSINYQTLSKKSVFQD